MKICPRCHKTYADDNLNFCLEDGSVLKQSAADLVPETLMMDSPRVTEPQPQMPSQPTAQPGRNTPQAYSVPPPKKSSKAWVWVLPILGGLVLLCGGGLVGFLFYVGTQVENTTANFTNSNTSSTPAPSNRKTPGSTNTNSTSTSTSTSTRTNLESVNLAGWVSNRSYGTTEFVDGEFLMSSKEKGYYYVLAGTKDQKTEDADTKVTVRNMDDGNTSLGYGLVFHSNPTPLQQGYAFLIDSKTRKYRVVNHTPGKENTVVAWTKSDAIQSGSGDNTLEARDLDDKIDLYINGKMVTSIRNVYGYADGIVGLYASDALKIAFKDLEIRK